MPRKPVPPERRPAQLTADQIRAAISKVRRRIGEVEAFEPNSINERSDPRPKALEHRIDETLIDVFGADTLEYERNKGMRLDRAPLIVGGIPVHELRAGFARGKAEALSRLETLISIFEERLADGLPNERAVPAAAPLPVRDPRSAFIVHGHDEAARESVARFLDRLGVHPVILHEQASRGNTVIEKLEEHSDVDFAVILLTPDDEGRPIGSESPLRMRARQNVVLELGFFLGKLDRRRVCALYRGDVEIPSDYLGVVYIPFDAESGWHLRLAKELRAAGFDIDMNKL